MIIVALVSVFLIAAGVALVYYGGVALAAGFAGLLALFGKVFKRG